MEKKLNPMMLFFPKRYTVFTSYSLLTNKTKILDLGKKGFKGIGIVVLLFIPFLTTDGSVHV